MGENILIKLRQPNIVDHTDKLHQQSDEAFFRYYLSEKIGIFGLEIDIEDIDPNYPGQMPPPTPDQKTVIINPNTGDYIVPAAGRISSPFGMRIHPVSGKKKMHSGVDIANVQGTPIYATKSGKVVLASSLNGYGNVIYLDHGDGTSSRYAHLMSGGILVTLNQTVVQGQLIGKMGSTGISTGSHLHFEIRINGVAQNPANFVPQLKK